MLIDTANIGGTAEVASVLDCPKQQIYALRRNAAFPAPFMTLASTPLWDMEQVRTFKEGWKRRPKAPVAAS